MVKAKLDGAEFEATGDDEFVRELYRKWLDTIRRLRRVPIETKIAELQSSLTEQRRLLKKFDANWPALGKQQLADQTTSPISGVVRQ